MNDTIRGRIQNDIIANADGTQVSIVDKRFFGAITIIGENHAEAAEYLKEHLTECKTRGAEIKLHFEVEEKFKVALDVGCQLDNKTHILRRVCLYVHFREYTNVLFYSLTKQK